MSEDQRGPHVTRDGVLARSRNGAVLERRLTQRQRPRQAAKLDARLAALGLEWRSARARLSVNLFESRNSLESVNWALAWRRACRCRARPTRARCWRQTGLLARPVAHG